MSDNEYDYTTRQGLNVTSDGLCFPGTIYFDRTTQQYTRNMHEPWTKTGTRQVSGWYDAIDETWDELTSEYGQVFLLKPLEKDRFAGASK